MRAHTILAALIAALTLGAVVPATTGARHTDTRGTVFVTERQLGSLTAFDGATGTPVWTAPTGAAPIGVTLPNGTHKVYTSDEGSNQMSVFDARTGASLGTIPMGPAPHHLLASENGRRIYVGEFGQNTVGVVDTAGDTELAHLVASPLPNARTHAVFITPDGTDLYAANTRAVRTEVGDVGHIDARSGRLLCNTEVGVDPSEILVTPNGKRGYVSVRGENKVKELDLREDCPVLTGREAIVGTQPDTLQLTNDGDTLVVTLRGTPAQISLLDTSTFTVQLVDVPGHTTTGHHWLSRDGEFSFVAVENPGGLAVVDNDTGQVVADYPYPNPPGGNRPHGVFYVPRPWGRGDDAPTARSPRPSSCRRWRGRKCGKRPMIRSVASTSVAATVHDPRGAREVAIAVVLLPASEADPSLQPAAVSRLARLGVTSVALVRDERTLALVVEGWAFEPSRSADAVIAAVARDSGSAQTLHPIAELAVSAAALPSGGP
jgi:DNA-binding beta-propeller fold protein YncE